MLRKIALVGLLVLVVRVIPVSAAVWENKPKPDSTTLLYLPLDENSGTKTKDVSGNNYDGELSKDAKWAEGKFGSGVAFDGVSGGCIAIPEKLNNLENFTVECWVKVNKIPGKEDYFGQIIHSPGVYWMLSVVPEKGTFLGVTWDEENHWAYGTEKIVLGQWYHVAMTYEGGKRETKLYVNGKLDGATTYIGGKGYVPGGEMLIGINSDRILGQLNGVIDEVMISETVKKFER